jgi:hypothetical protein
LNALEIGAAFLVVAVSVTIAFREHRRWSLLGVFLLLLATSFSVAHVSQFATVDEYGLALGAAVDSDHLLRTWQYGGLHTTAAIFLPLSKLLALIVPGFSSEQVALPLLKVLHWAMSALLLIALALQAAKLVGDEKRTQSNFFVLATLLLLLPVNSLAIKTFNYDAISLIGAVLACLLMVRAYRERVARLGRLAVIVAAIAAQEKLNASPILLICLYCNGLLVADLTQRTPWLDALKTLTLDTVIALLVGVVSGFVYASVTVQPLPADFLLEAAIDPLVAWAYMPFVFLLNEPELFEQWAIFLVPAIVVAIGLAQVLTLLLRGRRVGAWLSWARVDRAALSVLPIAVCAAIVGALVIKPKWGPFFPSEIPAVNETHRINGMFLHFGMDTLTQHYAAYLLYACAVCFVSLPFVFWLAALVAARFRRAPPTLPPGLSALLWLGYAFVLLAVLLRVPLTAKYLCISILLVAVVVAIRVLQIGAATPTSAWTLAAIGIVAAVLVEVAPFRPLYATFRPFWLEYGDLQPKPGFVNASWVGWGEETMQAGLKIQRSCARNAGKFKGIPCGEIRLHSGYVGMWLGSHAIKQDVSLDRRFDSSVDFFVINRSLFAQSPASLKPTIPPVFTIEARGYPMAWVYRGDLLAASGWFDR